MSRAIAKAIMKYKSSLDGTLFNGLVMDDNSNTTTPEKTVITNESEILYRIQIAASTRMIKTASYNFKGLSPITRLQKGTLHRYYYGGFTSYKKAKSALNSVKRKGYKGAYIKAFSGNVEVSITPLMKSN